MAKLPTIVETRKMTVEDLRSEAATIRRLVARIRLGVELNKEKDTSQMRKLRKHMAQILTVLQEKSATHSSHSSPDDKKSKKSLSKSPKATTLSART